MSKGLKNKLICSLCLVLFVSLFSFMITAFNVKTSYAVENEIIYALAFNEFEIENYSDKMTVKDPNGNQVTVTNGKFTPDKAGDYELSTFDGKQILRVFLSVPVSNYAFSFAINQTYATNEIIQLPSATITSAITDGAKYTVYIEKEGELCKKIAFGEQLFFQPSEEGEYTIIYTYIDYFGYISNKCFTIAVSDLPVIAFNPPSALVYGDLVSVETTYAYYGADRVMATHEIKDPDGQIIDISSGAFKPSKLGNYTWKVSVEMLGAPLSNTYTIPCEIYTAGQFTALRMAKDPVSNVSIPNASDYLQAGQKGVLLEGNVTGATYQFKNVIDLNSATFDKNVMSFLPYFQDGQGYVEDLTVRLTDVYDKYNSISIQFKRSPFHKDYTYVTAEYGGRHYAYDNESYVLTGVNGPVKIGDEYFFGGIMPANWSMVGQHEFGNKFDVYSFGLDYANRDMILDLTSSGRDGRYVLCDYDNPVWVGGREYTWNGFTTGEAYLTVEFGTIVGNSAAILVTEVMGQSLAGYTAIDNVAPSLNFDVDSEHLSQMPYGIVGQEYKLPVAKALDTVCGEIQVETRLTLNSQNVPLNGAFIPEEAGEYKVKYTATDMNGNVAEKEFSFTVYSQDTKPEIDMQLKAYQPPKTGSYFAIPEIEVTNVSGSYQINTSIEYCGQSVQVDQAGKIYIDKIGDIIINASLTDWLGQTAEKQFTVSVTTSDITFNIPNRYGVAQVGRTLKFADAIVNDFVKTNPSDQIQQKIYVNNQLLSDNAYTVKQGDISLNVRYEISCGDKQGVSEYDIAIYTGIPDLFKLENTSMVYAGTYSDELRFNFTDNGSVALVNAVSHNLLQVTLTVTNFSVANKDGFYIDVKLADATYDSQSVFVRVRHSDNSNVTLQLNGVGDIYRLSGSFSNAVLFTFFYDCEKNIIKEAVSEKQIFKIANCENGDVFNGFSSGAVKFSFTTNGISSGDNVQVRLNTISNETFITNIVMGKDIIKPVASLPVNNEIITLNLNEKFVINPPKAYDVVQGVFGLKVSVVSPSGQTLLDKQELTEAFELTLTEYGRYSIYFETFEPTFTVKGTKDLFIDVKDVVLPEITLKGELNQSYNLGYTVKIIGATATDNYSTDLKVKILIYDPNYRNVLVEEGQDYRFVLKGSYKIVYVATDDAGNTARIIRYMEIV